MSNNDIDVREKREELLKLWQRMFRICETTVGQIERGEAELKASMLKELNAFLKTSAATLVELEKAQEADKQKDLQEALEAPVEDVDDIGDALPFPAGGVEQGAAESPSERLVEVNPLAQPLEY